MRDSLYSDSISTVKKNGTRHDGIKASVQGNKIHTANARVPIEDGDLIVRKLPNGVEERFTVLEAHFHNVPAQMKRGDLSDFYELDVRRETSLKAESKASFSIGTFIQGDMTGGSVTSVGVANGDVQQVVNDPARLNAELNAIMERLHEEVKPYLSARDFIMYAKTTEQLQTQMVAQAPVSHAAIKRLIGALTLLDNANGTLELLLKIWPLIQVLLLLAASLAK